MGGFLFFLKIVKKKMKLNFNRLFIYLLYYIFTANTNNKFDKNLKIWKKKTKIMEKLFNIFMNIIRMALPCRLHSYHNSLNRSNRFITLTKALFSFIYSISRQFDIKSADAYCLQLLSVLICISSLFFTFIITNNSFILDL